MKLLKKFFSLGTLLIIIFLMSNTASAIIAEKKCGDFLFRVKIINEKDIGDIQHFLYYQEVGQKKKLFYKTEPGVTLSTACIQNNKKEYLMLFNVYYGGNVAPEDIYGIYDPVAKKMLIKPEDWPNGNSKQVEKILGFEPIFFYEDKNEDFFCCGIQICNYHFGNCGGE